MKYDLKEKSYQIPTTMQRQLKAYDPYDANRFSYIHSRGGFNTFCRRNMYASTIQPAEKYDDCFLKLKKKFSNCSENQTQEFEQLGQFFSGLKELMFLELDLEEQRIALGK